MNFLEYENLYNKTLEKLTQIILEETEAEPEDIVLDLELLKSECYYSYGFSNISYSRPPDIGEFFAKGGKVHYSLNLFTGESAYGFIEGGFIGRLEEEFEIEIGDDDFDQIRTVREVLFYLLEKQYEITFEQAQLFEEQIKANKEKIKQEQEAKILWEKEIKTFQFLSNHNIQEETLLNLLNNQEIINNWETIEHLIYLIDNEKVTIDDTVKFAYIFQNQFLVSNLKCLNKIINFIKNTGISKNELVSIVEKGNISQIREKINILQEKLSKKEQEINSKENEINTTNKQLRKLESQVQQFRDEAKKIRNELDYFLEARK